MSLIDDEAGTGGTTVDPPAGKESSIGPGGASLMESFVRLVRGRPGGRDAECRPPHRAADPGLLVDGLNDWPPGSLAAVGSTQSRSGGATRDAQVPFTEVGGFRIIREVGRGGMGVVYEAERPPLARRVAVKVLPPTASLDPRHRQRFVIEAQAAALLSHENIVPVLEFGSDRGVDYYAMPFIKGWSLGEVIRDRRTPRPGGARESGRYGTSGSGRRVPADSKSGPEDGPEAVAPCLASGGRAYVLAVARLGLQAAEALDHAHAVGVIHRDVKPSNLLVDARGHLWVADFGLARIGQGDAALTRTGDLLGTLRYMSPEQLRGDRGGASPQSDLYALGATLYELLTLRPAFECQDREELLRRVLQDDPVAPRRVNPSVPRDLETVVQKAMAKEASARYASAAALAEDLRRFLDDRPVLARRPGPIGRAVRWSRRRRAVVVTAATVLMLALSVSTVLLLDAKRRTDAALLSHKQARTLQARAFLTSLGTVDQITRAVGDPGTLDRARVQQALNLSLNFYDGIAKDLARDDSMQEVVATALHSAGHLRMTAGRPDGRRDYRRSAALFETLAARKPAFVWLRTHLIETLKEYSDLLTAPQDAAEAEAAFRRALAVADGLLEDKTGDPHCFNMALAPAFNDLAWALVRRPPARPGDAAAAVRLARKATSWEPDQPAYWNTLAAAHYRAGDWSAAADCLERATGRTGGTVCDWLLLAAVRERQGRSAEARSFYDRSADLLRREPAGAADADTLAIREEVSRLFDAPKSGPVEHASR